MKLFDVIQLIGGIIVSVGYIPQIVQIIKTHSIRDLNIKTYLALFIGIGMMEIYATEQFLNGTAKMFFVTNTISLIMVGAILELISLHKYGVLSSKEVVKEALFITRWGDGATIATPCKVNLKTKEITDIVCVDYNADTPLEQECVEIDGCEYEVCGEDDSPKDGQFWIA